MNIETVTDKCFEESDNHEVSGCSLLKNPWFQQQFLIAVNF